MPDQPAPDRVMPQVYEEMRQRGVTVGQLLRLVKAGADLEQVSRDVLAYKDELPEEIIEAAKAAVDVLDGGDGRIYA